MESRKMTASSASVVQLDCRWQSNNWGKRGSRSEVARLLKSCDPSFEIDEETTYAELWAGDHRKWPSMIHGTTQTLEDWLTEHPECLGDDVTSRFGHRLPFLLKVLSINLTLSLQAHPGRELAVKLHARDPVNYLDSNHKPEMCIALTPFRGMCGFRPVKEVARFLNDIDEFATVVGEENAANLARVSRTDDAAQHEIAMRSCFETLCRQDEDTVRSELRKLVNKVKRLVISGDDARMYEAEVLLKLYNEYLDDVGCFSVYFLNVISLQPGEAIFIGAGVLHAYLDGECIECLASSDNVLRAGLTAKYKDLDTLVDMLDYQGKPASKYKLSGQTTRAEDGCLIQRYDTPVEDFSAMRLQIPEHARSTQLSALPSGSLLLCVKGQGNLFSRSMTEPMTIREGVVLFISANEECTLNAEGEMMLFRAFAGINIKPHSSPGVY